METIKKTEGSYDLRISRIHQGAEIVGRILTAPVKVDEHTYRIVDQEQKGCPYALQISDKSVGNTLIMNLSKDEAYALHDSAAAKFRAGNTVRHIASWIARRYSNVLLIENSFLLLVHAALLSSRKQAILVASGVTVGFSLLVSGGVIMHLVLLSPSPVFFDAMGLLSGTYLIYLGISSLKQACERLKPP